MTVVLCTSQYAYSPFSLSPPLILTCQLAAHDGGDHMAVGRSQIVSWTDEQAC